MEGFAGKVCGATVSGLGLCQAPSQLSPPHAEELGVGCMGQDAASAPTAHLGRLAAPPPARGHGGRAATSRTSALPAALLASSLEGSR